MASSVTVSTTTTSCSTCSGSYTTTFTSESTKCSSPTPDRDAAAPKRGISPLPSISEHDTVRSPSTGTALSTDQSSPSPPRAGKKRRQSTFKHTTTGLMRSQVSSPLMGVSSNIMQYNGPHCMDINDPRLEVRHGLHMDYVLRLGGHIKTVLYYPKKQTCTVFFTGGVHRYIKNELDEEFEETPVTSDINKLLYSVDLGVYVGVCRQKLKLLNRSFQSLCEVETTGRITAATFNQWSGEVVTASPGRIMTWVFRQGAKSLAHSLTFTHGLLPKEEIHLLHLEPVPGNAQRIFVGLGCSVKVFLMVSGKPMEYLKDIHSRPLSALLFFRPLRLLLTASKDGSIKVWDSSRRLLCTFVGHSGPVTYLVPYPYGPMVVSCSLDATIRVWDVSTHDQVQKVENVLPLEGICCEPGTYSLLSYSSRQLKVWYIMQLYAQASNIGSLCTSLRVTSHPLLPMRVLSTCADSAVRVVSPITGDVLTTALLSVERTVTSVCYFPLKDSLYVLDECGDLCMFDTRDNPSSLKATWQCPGQLGYFSCLALYEMAMDEEEISELLESDKWLGVTFDARLLSRHRMAEKSPLQAMKEGQSLLLAGTSEGHVAVVESTDGRVWFSAQGHEGPVVMMASNPKREHIISASKDPTLHVWEVSPHSKEPLFLLCSFSLASPPSLLVSSKDRLCVARNNPELSSHTLDMFNIATKETFSADPDSSHSDTITGVDVTHKLRLFASCSLDFTVRIWTEDNHPVRILHLDTAPDGIVFCSGQADIMIAVQTHLYTIGNFTYFTETLHKQIVAFFFPELVSEIRNAWSVDPHSLEPQDRCRLLLVDNTITQDSYSGDLSTEEMALVEETAKKKKSAISVIMEREKEIKAISEGSVSSSKSHLSLTKKEKEVTWKRFLRMIRPDEDRIEYVISEEDDFDPDANSQEEEEEIFISSHYTKGPSHQFFPPLATFDPPYPIAPDCTLPNSVVLSKLRKSDADKSLAENWKPPSISTKQRNLMAEMEEAEEEEEDEEDSELMGRFQAALAAETASSTGSPTPPSTPSPPPPPPKRVIVPSKPIEKLIAPKPIKRPTPPRKVTPPPTPPMTPPSPSPPPTPLPEYIAQFFGERWFETLFPNANSSTFPKPWSVTSFINVLLSKLVHPLIGYDIKADICRVIQKLLRYHEAQNKNEVHNTVLDLLKGSPVLSTHVKYEKPLVMHGLQLIFFLNRMDAEFAVLLMVHYIQGEEELRCTIMEYFKLHGLKDPQGYFTAAMLKIPEVKKGVLAEGKSLGTGVIYDRCRQWMEYWTEEFHLNSHSKSLWGKKQTTKSLLKLPSKESGIRQQQKVSFTKDGPKSPTLPPYKPMDVTNYFVTVEHEKAMARLRVMTPSPVPTPEPQEDVKRNSIIALPKITKHGMLTRLGETHCSQCHPERETGYVLLHHLPRDYNRPHPSGSTRLWRNFTRCITLALTPQNVNPFLTEEERLALEEPSNRGSIQGMIKYFVHEKSYLRTPDQ